MCVGGVTYNPDNQRFSAIFHYFVKVLNEASSSTQGAVFQEFPEVPPSPLLWNNRKRRASSTNNLFSSPSLAQEKCLFV